MTINRDAYEFVWENSNGEVEGIWMSGGEKLYKTIMFTGRMEKEGLLKEGIIIKLVV